MLTDILISIISIVCALAQRTYTNHTQKKKKKSIINNNKYAAGISAFWLKHTWL